MEKTIRNVGIVDNLRDEFKFHKSPKGVLRCDFELLF